MMHSTPLAMPVTAKEAVHGAGAGVHGYDFHQIECAAHKACGQADADGYGEFRSYQAG